MDALAIERLAVYASRIRIVARVRVAPFARLSTPELASRIKQEFPLVARHACVNDVGSSFGDVMDCTPLPHVLEHLVIDLQTRACAQCGECGVLGGESSRTAGGRGGRALDEEPGLACGMPPAMPGRRPPSGAFAFVGTSEWLDEARGLACVEVNFTDDLVALRAFRDAARFLNAVVVG